MRVFTSTCLVILVCLTGTASAAERVHLAVASNFAATGEKLKADFEANSPYRLSISLGSSGKLFAQIVNGAPFHVFLSADQEKPAALETRGISASRHTYALGRLAIWVREPTSEDWQVQLRSMTRIAVANPRLAPYGAAAKATLANLGLLEVTKSKQVMGENIGQTFQFVRSGNADAGFIAHSQIPFVPENSGLVVVIPDDYHSPIAQDAVLLERGATHPGARSFYEFLLGERAQQIIRADGYRIEPSAEKGHGFNL